MTDLDLAQALINALAECPWCDGTTFFNHGLPDGVTAKCAYCQGKGETTGNEKATELLAEWRKTHPKL